MPRAERAQEFLINPLAVTRDPVRRAMSLPAQAVYDTLWLESWNEKIPGELPADEGILSRLAQVSEAQWADVRNEVATGFEVSAEAWICRAVQRTKCEQDRWRTKWRKQKKRQRLRGADSPPLSATLSSDGSGSGTGTGSNPPNTLPEWLPSESWNRWVQFRKSMGPKAKFTPDAEKLSLRTLESLREANDPTAVIEQSIERGWTGLFPLKSGIANGSSHEAILRARK